MDKNKTLVVAEMAGTHEGSLDIALKLIDIASKSKANAVKLHMYYPEEYITNSHKIYPIIKKLAFKEEEWKKIFNYAKKKGLIIIAVTADKKSVELANNLNTDAFFIYPACIDELDLIENIAKKSKPIYIQTGGVTLEELEKSINLIKSFNNNKITLIHGYQAFPTRLEEIKLNYLKLFKDKFNLDVGIEDHSEGGTKISMVIPLVALSYGISTIVKHFTLDRNLKMMDYESALNPNELEEFIEVLREVEKTLGPNKFTEFSEEEKTYRRYVKKSIVAKRDILKGERLTKEDIAFKRAEGGLSPSDTKEILGKSINKNIQKNNIITKNDLE